jgi:RNA polymerase sigma-70 factor (sigma-E family)
MARTRDEEFARFVADRSAALLRLAYLLTGDRHDAEDVLQTALVRAYLRWRSITGDPEGYVRRVLVTVSVDEWRRPHRRREVPSESMPERPVLSEVFGEVDGRQQLRVALRALPSRQRAAVVLRYWIGLDVAETAALLGCSAGTVRSQSARGLDKLRAAYDSRVRQPEEGRAEH